MKQYLFVLIAAFAFHSAVSAQTADTPKKPKQEQVRTQKQDRAQCQAIAKSGKQCKRKAMDGSQYCKMHAKKMANDNKK
jgi:hypothetical protein